jgi:hypothetical protein
MVCCHVTFDLRTGANGPEMTADGFGYTSHTENEKMLLVPLSSVKKVILIETYIGFVSK